MTNKSNLFLKEIKFIGFSLKIYQLFLVFLLVLVSILIKSNSLNKIPVFVDEAIYVRWSQIMKNEAQLRFLPLSDGKQPLFMWTTIPFFKIFADPLIAGRMVSVFCGAGTTLGVFLLSYLIFKSFFWAMIAGAIYIFVPFTFVFDRMALVDSLLSFFGIWSLNLALLLFSLPRLDLSLILGLVLGVGLITKSPAMFFLVLSLATVLSPLVLGKKPSMEFLKRPLFSFFILILAFIIYNVLKLGPNFHMIAIRNKDYLWPLSEIAKHPLDPLVPHLKDAIRYYWHYFARLGFILSLLGIFVSLKKILSKKGFLENIYFLILLVWLILPLVVQSAMGKVFTARYIFYGVPIMVVFLVVGLRFLFTIFKNKIFYCLVFVTLFLSFFNFDIKLLSDPTKAIWPLDERKGYLEDWTSGWGIKETADYLINSETQAHIVIGTEGYFGTLPDGLQMYLQGYEEKITAIGVGYPIKSIPESLINAKDFGDDVYLLVNKSRFKIKDQIGLELLKEYKKPGNDSLLFLKLK